MASFIRIAWLFVGVFVITLGGLDTLSARYNEAMHWVFFGSYALDWSVRFADMFGITPAPCKLGRFRDGEIFVEILQDTQDQKVVVVQSICNHDALMEALLIADALKRDGCKRIVAFFPYLGYMRQEKRIQSGTPISARLVIKLLEKSGYDAFVVCDLHSKQIEGFFSKPVYHVSAAPLFEKDIAERFSDPEALIIVSPDSGGLHRARSMAKRLKIPLAVVDKYRQRPGQSQVLQILGDVSDKVCIIVDDMVDSGGTLMNAAIALKNRGAREVHCYCTHGILSKKAINNIKTSQINSLTLSDSLPVQKTWENLRILSVASLFASQVRK